MAPPHPFAATLRGAASHILQHYTNATDEQCRVVMVQQMKKMYDQHILQVMFSTRPLLDVNPFLFITRQQALEWDRTHPEDGLYFYDAANTKILPAVWQGVKCVPAHLEDLKVIEGRDMAMFHTHEGRMFIGKVITPVRSGLALSFYLEDPSGAVFPVIINYPTPIPHFALSLPNTLAKLYPLGAIFAIKSPRVGLSVSGGYAIKVDLPHEIEEVHPEDPVVRGMKWQDGLEERAPERLSDCKDGGHKAMLNQNYCVALRLYSFALSDPVAKSSAFITMMFLLDRTYAYQALGLHGHAYRDALRAREVIDNNNVTIPEALHNHIQLQIAKAAISLRLYRTAIKACDDAAHSSTMTGFVKMVRERAEKRLKEQESGAHDWVSIFRESLKDTQSEIDVGDYVSPACNVTQVAGCGRGVKATRDIVPGELIMVSKAIAPTCPGLDAPNVYVNCYDFESKSIVPHDTYVFVYRMLHRIYDDPSLLEVLKGFSSAIVPSPRDLPQPADEATRLTLLFTPPPPSMGLNIFRQITRTNCFGGYSVTPIGLGFDRMLEKKAFDDYRAAVSAGRVGGKMLLLHGMPAMFNHSCWGNMTECWFSDVMVMRASRHIAKGDELLVSYAPGFVAYPKRLSILINWNFECACIICQADTHPDEDCATRSRIIDSHADGLLSAIPVKLSKLGVEVPPEMMVVHAQKAVGLEGVVREVEGTYARGRREDTKAELGMVYNRLGRRYLCSAQGVKAREALMLSLKHAGAVLTTPAQEKYLHRKVYESHYLEDEVIMTMMLLAVLELYNNKSDAANWARTGLWFHRVRYGGGKELFQERYGHLLANIPIDSASPRSPRETSFEPSKVYEAKATVRALADAMGLDVVVDDADGVDGLVEGYDGESIRRPYQESP
ncbi:hypothetical protein B9479_007156 [Cryptococcus floricola]|uniref:SET domain-containing protein n=1 Tax=Cryptococcus floricola TaxID=2591691 RepID=A0A5D3AQB8_9TREE|nr:hypothetical protein B9479_007156 [Cryptococcus floricola]